MASVSELVATVAIHPSPVELLQMLAELRRVEERLQPFIQRAHTILETATSAEYSNTEREEDQRILNLVGESLRLLGNALVALSDLRCNLLSPAPRHLHVVRPMSHYTNPGAVHHMPLQMNLGATVTMAANGSEGQAPPTQPTAQSEQAGQGQTPSSNQQPGPAGPRVIRVSHQAVPVVMMQMNPDGSGVNPPTGQTAPGQPDFMRNLMQQISQYAAAVATSAVTGQPIPAQATPPGPSTPTTTPTSAPAPPQPQPRVVFTRPTFTPPAPPPPFSGGTIHMRPGVPGQMMNDLVRPLLVPGQTGHTGTSSHSSSSSSSSSFSFSSSSSSSGPTVPPTSESSAPHDQSQTGSGQALPPDLSQLLGSLLGGVAGGVAPPITVTSSGVPAFIQGVNDFMQQASQPVFSAPPPPSGTPGPVPSGTPGPPPPGPGPAPPGVAVDPEFFTGIVRGVLTSMMGPLGQGQGDTESIAQFIQRLSQSSNLFTASEETSDVTSTLIGSAGFFGELLTLVCQSFSMSDLVLLLHGQHQPLGRIQPQLARFFTHNYLNDQEPSDHNITAAADSLVNELEEYITESFSESSVSVLEGVDITQTNMSCFRQQLARIATHILRCTDESFGPRLLQMCNQALFESLALNLHCLQGNQTALTSVINHRIRRMSSDMSPSLVNWMTSMMTMRLQVVLEHLPLTSTNIQQYIVSTQTEQTSDSQGPETKPSEPNQESPDDAVSAPQESRTLPLETRTLLSETRTLPLETRTLLGDRGACGGTPLGSAVVTSSSWGEDGESESWEAAVPPEWVPIIRCDLLSQRKVKSQPPLSDAYLTGMPAKRRKVGKRRSSTRYKFYFDDLMTGQTGGALLSLSDAVSQAARSAGVRPLSPTGLQEELDSQELQEAYSDQVKADLKRRVEDDPDFNAQQFPNAHQAFSPDS
ncbi:Large proline-rich protein bag6-B [Merluccius polli]|uniref:Large proline-rich protein bag6-B n=1 Tax=Merluccius polli TaxID=89951 RepID=A0AA47NCB3_MERPO|nr:Large proline-rich protein bag6-B [Merluccius polli]